MSSESSIDGTPTIPTGTEQAGASRAHRTAQHGGTQVRRPDGGRLRQARSSRRPPSWPRDGGCGRDDHRRRGRERPGAEPAGRGGGQAPSNKHTEVRPPRTPKRGTPPPPSPRVSSMSPKDVRKLPTPYQTHLPSSSSSCSSSSLSSAVSSKPDGFATSKRRQRTNGGSKRTVVTFGATQREGRSGSNGQVRLSHGTVSRAPLGERRDGNGTGGLTNKTKRKKK